MSTRKLLHGLLFNCSLAPSCELHRNKSPLLLPADQTADRQRVTHVLTGQCKTQARKMTNQIVKMEKQQDQTTLPMVLPFFQPCHLVPHFAACTFRGSALITACDRVNMLVFWFEHLSGYLSIFIFIFTSFYLLSWTSFVEIKFTLCHVILFNKGGQQTLRQSYRHSYDFLVFINLQCLVYF